MTTTPRWSAALLARVLPEEERDAILGDLEEGFRDRVRKKGASRARRWYRREALRVALGFARERVRERTARPLGAADDVDGGGGTARGGGGGMDAVRRDVSATVRGLAKRPGFVAIAAITLALGVGANTAIFSVLHRSLLAPLPYPDADNLVWVSDARIGGWDGNSSSIPNLLDVRERSGALAGLAIYQSHSANLAGEGEARRTVGLAVTPDFFEILGLPLRLGRDFEEEDNLAGAAPTVILGHDLWVSRFGSDPSIVGRTVELNTESYTVIGVGPEQLEFVGSPEVFAPFRWNPAELSRGARGVNSIARLRDGVTVETARTDLENVFAELRAEYPGANEGWSMSARPLREWIVGRQARSQLLLLLGAAGLVLLIACVNVANLLLARAETRGRETAVRVALGAGRSRIVSLFLAEAVLLSLVGGALGMVVGIGGMELLERVLAGSMPGTGSGFSLPVLGFGVGVALLSGILTGLLPAFTTRIRDLAEGLREGGRGSTGAGSGLRRGLVVVEVALAVTLVAGAGLLLRSFWAVSSIDLGLESPDEVVVFQVSLPEATYPDLQSRADFFTGLTERLDGIPGVESAAITSRLPLNAGTNVTELFLEDAPDRTAGFVELRTVTPELFDLLGIDLLRGRNLEAGDSRDELTSVVISEQLARELTEENEEILGRSIQVWGGFTATVVGVVADFRDRGPTEEAPPTIYFHVGARFQPTAAAVLVRAAGDPLEVVAPARQALASVDPSVAAYSIRLLDDYLTQVVGRGRTAPLTLILLFGVVAILLGAVGIYGVMSWFVAQRTREMGVRIALGADRSSVARMVLRQGVRMTALGIVLGVAGALASGRLLAGLLFDVRPLDPVTHLVVALVLSAVAVLATWLPAARAARIDPMEAFRES